MKPQLTGSHRKTYDSIIRHPEARTLDWQDVRSMLGALADVVEELDGSLKITRNGQTLALHPSLDKNVPEVEELLKIRQFLEQSGEATPAAEGVHLLVVIDHRQARVYKTEVHGSVPQRIQPYNPGGFGRHLHYIQSEDEASGQRKPERKSFYEAVAKTLEGAEQILIFGSGTGASSAMEELVAQLKQHHGDVAKRIVGSIVLDETHLTEDQLLAKARDYYARIASQSVTHSPSAKTGPVR